MTKHIVVIWQYNRLISIMSLLTWFFAINPTYAFLHLDTDGFDSGTDRTIFAMELQADGKILIGGDFYNANNGVIWKFARLNSDGSDDKSFYRSSTDLGHQLNGPVYAVAQQPDGKVLVAGDFDEFTYRDRKDRRDLFRYNADGSFDYDFIANTEEGLHRQVNALVLQPDGKVLVGGAFSSINSISQNYIARLNTDGSLDTSFSPIINAPVLSLTLQADGKVLVGGTFTNVNGETRNRFARLNANGSLDTGFAPSPGTGTVNSEVYTLAQQADGKVLVGGWFSTINGITRKNIARLNTDGSIDSTLSLDVNGKIRSLKLQADGKVLIGGEFTRINGFPRNRIARLNTDGSLDSSFNPSNNGTTDGAVYTLAPQSDGKVLIAGSFTYYSDSRERHLARLNDNGALDNGYKRGSGPNDKVYAIALQADGKALIGGDFTNIQGWAHDDNRVARLTIRGRLDTSFRTGTGANASVFTLTQQPDSKVLIAGAFTNFNGSIREHIARLNGDGGLDPGFSPSINGTIRAMLLQADGKILIGGGFTLVNGVPRNRIARLNPDGSLDSTFNPGSGASSWVRAIAQRPNGKILIGGSFTTVNGVEHWTVAQLNANGSLDISFNLGRIETDGGGLGTVYAMRLQVDGKILIGGKFDFINDSIRAPRKNIARLTPDGNLDWGFITRYGTDNPYYFPPERDDAVYALAPQANGDVLIGGAFTLVSDKVRMRFARLYADGSLDARYKLTSDWGPDDTVYALTQQVDGKVLFGGAFTRALPDTALYLTNYLFRMGVYHSPFNLAEAVETALQDLSILDSGASVNWLTQGVGPALERVVFDVSSSPNGGWSVLGNGQYSPGGWKLSNIDLPAEQTHYIRARGYYGTGSRIESIIQVHPKTSIQSGCFPYTPHNGRIMMICW